MPSFEYEGYGADGRAVRGVQLGADIGTATQTLKTRGVTLSSIRPAQIAGDPLVPAPRPEAPRPAATATLDDTPTFPPGLEPRPYLQSHVVGPLVGTVRLTELSFFFQQFGTMVNAGVPIVQCLATLSGQSGSPKLTSILREAQAAVEQGHPMSAVFQRYPEVFSPIIMSLLRAGEEGGFLAEASRQIADYLEHEIGLRRLYSRLTMLPKLELGFAVLVVFATNLIIASVAPGGRGLPNPFTDPRFYIPVSILVVFLFLFFRVGLRHGLVRRLWDASVRYIPGYGKVAYGMAMARWGRAFGALYQGGVEIPRAFQLAADATGNEELRARMSIAPEKLRAGVGIGDALEATNSVSPIVMNMVRTGETTGSLDQMLLSLSNYYQEESTKKAYQLATIAGIVIAVGVLIYIAAFIIFPFYMGYATDLVKMAEP